MHTLRLVGIEWVRMRLGGRTVFSPEGVILLPVVLTTGNDVNRNPSPEGDTGQPFRIFVSLWAAASWS
jgi:hypothetical protein